ncbi:MAG TPA: hypothetical protein VLN49_21470 [Gemmatimonadaceae bacterium]|nr:hypothetical protein [Gemmatimonadaceae bacterium]
MSAPDAAVRKTYGTIVIVGGGCYGSYYVRQLRRAVQADAITAECILVVDRDPHCMVGTAIAPERDDAASPPIRLHIGDWRTFFDEYLTNAARDPDAVRADAIVPSPLMPHLMAEWIVERARRRWPDRPVETRPFDEPPTVPWERAGADGTHYVSFATWTCPVNCIEPRTCPVTKGPRSWSLPDRLADHARGRSSAGRPIELAVLHCGHRAYGVGMFDTSAVVEADRHIATAAREHGVEVIVGTVSHCHGALTRLVIGEPSSAVPGSAIFSEDLIRHP